MADTHLEVEARETSGKGVARKLRRAGRIPAVLYGSGRPAVSLTLDPAVLRKLLHGSEMGMNTLFDLHVTDHTELDGKTVMVRDLQRDPVRGDFIHADLYEVDLAQKIEVEVPIHIAGKPRGVEMDGGVMDQSLRELHVACLPRAIPDEVVVDVRHLEIGDSIHVRELQLPPGVELMSEPELSVVSVVAPIKEEELEAAEAAEVEAPVAATEGEAPEAAEAGGESETGKEGGD